MVLFMIRSVANLAEVVNDGAIIDQNLFLWYLT